MKSLLVLLASLILTSTTMAETNKPEITDQFSDKIKDVKVIDGNLEITFRLHAAIYKVSKTNPKFAELQKMLESKKGSDKKVKIISSIPAMEIKEVSE